MSRPLKILVSAYGCGPGRGSEPGVGWHWPKQLAKVAEVWVLTPYSEKQPIEQYNRNDLPPQLRFVHTDLPAWIRPSNQNTVVRYALHYHLWQIWAYFYVRGLHKRIRFDVIHHLTLGAYWKPSFLALLPIPFIWGPVGGGESLPPEYLASLSWRGKLNELLRKVVHRLSEMDPFVRLTARRARLILAKTAQTAARVRLIGGGNLEIFSEAGIPSDELSKLTNVPIRSEMPVRFISIGRLLQWKGFELGLRGFARIHQEFPDLTYWIVGDGPERGRLTDAAQRLGISEKVKFLGWQSRTQVLEALASCDVLVHPSLHDSGGWVCLEAMAAGRPVICLDLGGPGVQVTEQTGFKIRAKTATEAVEQMADVMRLLATDRNLVTQLGNAGRKRVEQFGWENKLSLLTPFYLGLDKDLHAPPLADVAPQDIG
jgi:glycosyltransferase involved in cell wall biosynthesis